MLIVASVVLILIALGLPLFLTSRSIPEPEPVSPVDHLEDKKATIYESLRDLQAEYRMNKLSDADYERTKQDLQRELAVAHALELARRQLLERRVVAQRVDRGRDDLALRIDVGVPGELRGGVPLLALRLLVQLAQPVLDAAVVPDVARVERGQDRFELAVETRERVHGGGCHGSLRRGAVLGTLADAGPEFKERRERNRRELWATKGLGALGAYDPDERVEALDRMGIKAQLMFANNTLYDLRATTQAARDASVRYNDYALDFTRRTKGRCRAVCHINTSDVDFAIAEAHRVIKLGAKAVDLPCTQPPGGVSPSHEQWDPLWHCSQRPTCRPSSTWETRGCSSATRPRTPCSHTPPGATRRR